MDLKKHIPIPKNLHSEIVGDPTKNSYEKLSYMFNNDFFVLTDRVKTENPALVFYDFKSCCGYYFHVANVDLVQYVDTFKLCSDENDDYSFEFKRHAIWPQFSNYIEKCYKMALGAVPTQNSTHVYLEHKIDYIENFINNPDNLKFKDFSLCKEGFEFMVTKLNQKMLDDLIISPVQIEEPANDELVEPSPRRSLRI